MNRFTRIMTLFSAIAAIGALPAAAHAMDNDTDPAGPGGCHYSDQDGYDIPIHDGETVFVDGKLVTCKGGTVIVTTAPLTVNPGGGKAVSIKDIIGKATTTRVTLAQRLKAARIQHAALDQLRATGIKPGYRTVSIAGARNNATCQKFADAAEKALDAPTANASRTTATALASLAVSYYKAGQAIGCTYKAKA